MAILPKPISFSYDPQNAHATIIAPNYNSHHNSVPDENSFTLSATGIYVDADLS